MNTLKDYNYAVDSIAQISQSEYEEGDKILIRKTNQIFIYDGHGKYTDINCNDLRYAYSVIDGIA